MLLVLLGPELAAGVEVLGVEVPGVDFFPELADPRPRSDPSFSTHLGASLCVLVPLDPLVLLAAQLSRTFDGFGQG